MSPRLLTISPGWVGGFRTVRGITSILLVWSQGLGCSQRDAYLASSPKVEFQTEVSKPGGAYASSRSGAQPSRRSELPRCGEIFRNAVRRNRGGADTAAWG